MGGAKLCATPAHASRRPVGFGENLQRHHFNAAFGVGGYASGPMILAARLHGVPTVIFEPNVEPGFTNRVLARSPTAWPAVSRKPPSVLAIEPSPPAFPCATSFSPSPRKEHREPFNFLITGGSRGALPINRAMIDSLDL